MRHETRDKRRETTKSYPISSLGSFLSYSDFADRPIRAAMACGTDAPSYRT